MAIIRNIKNQDIVNIPPLGGLEQPAFRLTAERASQLRHRGSISLSWSYGFNTIYLVSISKYNKS